MPSSTLLIGDQEVATDPDLATLQNQVRLLPNVTFMVFNVGDQTQQTHFIQAIAEPPNFRVEKHAHGKRHWLQATSTEQVAELFDAFAQGDDNRLTAHDWQPITVLNDPHSAASIWGLAFFAILALGVAVVGAITVLF